MEKGFKLLINYFAYARFQQFELCQEQSGILGKKRAPAVFPAGLPLDQFHAEPLFHCVDMTPCLAVRNSHLARSSIDGTMSVDGFEQEPPSPAEHRLAVYFDPYLRPDLQTVMTFLHNAPPKKVLSLHSNHP
jgi:hypothetical protein